MACRHRWRSINQVPVIERCQKCGWKRRRVGLPDGLLEIKDGRTVSVDQTEGVRFNIRLKQLLRNLGITAAEVVEDMEKTIYDVQAPLEETP